MWHRPSIRTHLLGALAVALSGLGLCLASNSPAPTPVGATADPPTGAPVPPLDAKPVPDPTPTGGMTQSLDLDLTKDPRKDLQVRGSVAWEAGRLTLGPDAGVTRTLDQVGQASLSLRLTFPPLEDNDPKSTTRFAFQIRDRGDFVVEIVRRREGGKPVGEVRLIDRDAPGAANKVTRTLRAVPWAGEFPAAAWTFRHHHGLVTVYCGDTLVLVGHAGKEPVRDWVGKTRYPAPDHALYQKCGIGEPLEVVGWSLEQVGQPVTCVAVSGRASASYRVGLAPVWQKLVAGKKPAKEDFQDLSRGVRDVANLRVRMSRRILPEGQDHHSLQLEFEPWAAGEPDLSQLGDPSLVRVANIFGKRHHYYALAVAGVGMQYFWVGFEKELVVAERLLKQAAEVSEGALGIWHPDCLAVAAALAQVYLKTGKLDLAEPLLKTLSEAVAVWGTESPQYAAVLQITAVLHQYNGRLADAETALTRAAAATKNAPAALIALGELLIVMGEREKAADALKRADDALEAEIQRRWKGGDNPAEWKPLFVDQSRARALRARLFIQDGRPEPARKLVRDAFLTLVQISDGLGRPGRFPGWDAQLLTAFPDGHLVDHPSYSAVMIDIVDVFLALGDIVPATNAVRIVDQTPGQTRHDRGVLFQAMARLCEADPKVNIGIRPGFSERMRLEVVYREEAGKNPTLDRAEWWQKQALDELETFAGREHPDTIRLLQDLARRRWFVFGPKAAEGAVRDAFDRSMKLLSDRVLAGLPEAQAYQFLEANRPPTDLLLSCYRATAQDRGREAYEAVWLGKALGTRQLAERRRLLQAAAGNPDLTRLAGDLQATRQQLAQLSLSVPPESAAAARRQQLVKLGQKKEDLERELAKLSEPFRRTRDADRGGVADMVGRLPAGTAVVDFVERRQWTLSGGGGPAADAPVGKDGKVGKPEDPFPVGSVWTGKKHRDQTNATMPATLKITARDGENFKGVFTFDKTNVNAVAGTIKDGKLEWHTTKVLQGNENQPTKGAVKDNAIDATFRLVTRSGQKTFTATGTIKLSGEAAAAEVKAPAPAPAKGPARWVQTRGYDAFVVRPTPDKPGWSVAWVSLGDADEVDRLLDAWGAGMRPGGRPDAQVAEQLRRRLWGPIEASLAGCDRVILIPDGRLAQLPWAALPGRKAGTYLLEDYALGQAPYAQAVARALTDPVPDGNNFLVVGGIDYGPAGKWASLSGTAVEAERLEKLRRGPATVLLSGPAATKARLRDLLPTQRYVHLATHGDFLKPAAGRGTAADGPGGPLFDAAARNPLLLSMLVLAGANHPAKTDAHGLPVGSDSFLTAEEVMGLDLSRTELVVLSACETGLGKVRGGEGTFSLQRAFHVAGARAVVASLWKVPDNATQALMTRFHENLLTGRGGKPMGKADALREAQLWLLKEARVKPELLRGGLTREDDIAWQPGDPVPPYYWAAFVLSGDWR